MDFLRQENEQLKARDERKNLQKKKGFNKSG